MKNQGDILLNPIRMRIIQIMGDKAGRTVASIGELMSDVPRTTLYRHISILLQHEYLTISKEVKIRGTYEREYTFNSEALQTATANNIEKHTNTFLLKLMGDFNHYFKGNSDPIKDKLFLSSNVLLLSDSEHEQLTEKIFDVIQKHMNYPMEQGRKVRTISVVSSPCINEEDSNVQQY